MEPKALKFDNIARALHWISAVIILWAMLSGMAVSLLPNVEVTVELSREFPKKDIKRLITDFNVSLTILYIPIFLWRVAHALRVKKPPYFAPLSNTQIKVAHIAHICMYILIAVLLSSGLLMMNRPYAVFGLWNMAPIITDITWLDFFEQVHKYSSYALLFFITIHLSALLKHQHSGNKIMQRML
ncbi:hypothetical protein HG263_06420 [Pseudoalteromonas sp. JBTF-M23]|uniref:Cytochrome b561 bacterial/Ni-hydrogenase domain-containing protein n=1 Tax=Pseudoalteromonas caenipelagi TaxID=2726988 RepID=A0A849VB13_9GAMM|nr:cytochrome b/b6 domain-containing protein [Pseudoalteromonas caenipelagi]NOU50175.1 hypothetical protein [Pseudoalteromonas caenipelagi]